IVTFGMTDVGMNYWLRFFLSDMGKRDAIDGGVRDRVWYAFARRGIEFPYPTRHIEVREVDERTIARADERQIQASITALSRIDLFGGIERGELLALAARARKQPFMPGEVVIRQGDPGDTMFVVREGEVSVRVKSDGGDTEAARLTAGSFFGEMSLLTGAA